jgi:hypothetical protein
MSSTLAELVGQFAIDEKPLVEKYPSYLREFWNRERIKKPRDDGTKLDLAFEGRWGE